ncbi:MAG: kelch repeat-containing protein [Candidatus Limnocylindrales bacterium]
MTAARLHQSATLLSDGRVLIAGGQAMTDGNVWNDLDSAELYDPQTGAFSSTGSMRTAREGQTATLLPDGRVLIAGGSDLASAELYDPRTGTFSSTGSMMTARDGCTATLLPDGRVLMAGGHMDTSYLTIYFASAELYDPKTGTFSPTGSMTTARTGHTATLLSDGRVLVTGGEDVTGEAPTLTSRFLASAELYDPKTGTFSPTGSMTTARTGHTATLLAAGRVLIAGGSAGTVSTSDRYVPLTSAELYDTKSGTFGPAGSMITAREYQTATLLSDGRVLIAGGETTPGPLALAELYDPATGKFAATGSMITARESQTTTLLSDGRVLIAGGLASLLGDALASAELYQP